MQPVTVLVITMCSVINSRNSFILQLTSRYDFHAAKRANVNLTPQALSF